MMSLRLLLALTGFVIATAAPAQDLATLNPEKLPPPLDRPLKMLATTAMSGKGQDYFTLKPGQKAVVGTITGPAIIVRTWSTSSKSAMVSLDLTVDGKKQNLYEKGKPHGLSPGDPLQAMDKQAYWSYVPVAVKQKAVFTARSIEPAEDIKFYLQAGYRSVGPSELKLVGRGATSTLRAVVAGALKGAPGAKSKELGSGTATPGQPFAPALPGPVMVRELKLTLPPEATSEQLQTTRLTLNCDGSKTVDVPLGALFGQYWQLADYQSVAMAVQGRDLILRLPLPVAQTFSLALDGYGGKPLAQISVSLAGQTLPTAPQYHLCAQYFAQISVRDQPLQMLKVSGPGVYVGSNLAADGVERKTFAFLEGNEQIYVDGVTTPTIEGTGSEDYFNNSWYFETGQLARAFHGVTFIQPKDPPRVVAYRWMLTDCLPFGTGLQVDMQHGSRNGAPDVLYRGVVFWYQPGPVTVAEPAEAKAVVKPEEPDDEAPGNPLLLPLVMSLVAILVVVGMVVWLGRRRKA